MARTSRSLVGVTGVRHIVFVDVGLVIGIDTFVVPLTFVGSVGLVGIRGITGHCHLNVLFIDRPGSSHRNVRRHTSAPPALRRTRKTATSGIALQRNIANAFGWQR